MRTARTARAARARGGAQHAFEAAFRCAAHGHRGAFALLRGDLSQVDVDDARGVAPAVPAAVESRAAVSDLDQSGISDVEWQQMPITVVPNDYEGR